MSLPDSPAPRRARKRSALASFMFASRWLQLPVYLGLIVAQCMYVFHVRVELKDLVPGATPPGKLNETTIMLVAQTCIHAVFLLSAMAIAYTDRIMTHTQHLAKRH